MKEKIGYAYKSHFGVALMVACLGVTVFTYFHIAFVRVIINYFIELKTLSSFLLMKEGSCYLTYL